MENTGLFQHPDLDSLFCSYPRCKLIHYLNKRNITLYNIENTGL